MTRYDLANAAWQLAGDKALLLALAERADVLLLVECRTRDNRPLDVARALGPGWDVRQDCTSAARAGSVVAVRRGSRVTIRRSRICLASPAGPGVQARYRRQATLVDRGGRRPRRVRIAVQHNPLPATGRQRLAVDSACGWARRARRWRRARPRRRCWLWAGDANMPPEQMGHHLGAPHHYGQRPMVAAWSVGWGRVNTSTRRIHGSDHAVLTLTTQERS